MSDYFKADEELPLFATSRVNEECVIEVTDRDEPPEPDSKNRETVLEALRAGPVLCRAAETIVHRGQAVIGYLRSRGYVIDTIGEHYHLRSEPSDDLVRLPRSVMDLYYQTEHWKGLAKARKDRDGWKCCQCGATSNLEAHHWRYRLFEEDVEVDVMTLCEKCHADLHTLLRGSSVHHPLWVPKYVIERIEAQSK